ncbi:MAG: glycosyltransferase [bacterium]|nr:glycosyltransferase [bacterium]
MKISACIVLYHEEDVIQKCLDSLKGVVDEIIVVHDGPCKDKTLDICKRYTKKIFIRPRIGEAEPHRAFSFSKAQYDWILQIDADESLSEKARKNIKKLPTDVAAYELAWEFKLGNKNLPRRGLGKAYKLCFFNKDKVKYRGLLHEIPLVNGRKKKTELLLCHNPKYNNFTFKAFRTKWLRWTKIQAEQYIRNGNATMPAFMYFFRGLVHFIYYFIHYFRHGIINGWIGFKISILQGLYNFYVNYYIMKYHNKVKK